MLGAAFRAPRRVARAPRHLAAWLVWHSVRVSLLDDLDSPSPPSADLGRGPARHSGAH